MPFLYVPCIRSGDPLSRTDTDPWRTGMFTKAAALTALTAAAFAVAAPAQAETAVTTALPAANMEAVLKAAQIDPRRADDTQTPGAHDSVLLVEQALQAKGLLDSQYVDGYF